jgi:hypothetical protein
VSAVLGALVGQVGSVGSGYLVEVVTKALDRARQAGAGESSPAQLREAIEDELRALTSDDEGALGLRREMAALLRAVGGIDIAVSAAVQTGVEEVQQALFAAVTDLGAEFGWMLAQTRQTLIKVQDEQGRQGVEQRHQTDLARENLVKTNLVIQRLELLIGIPSREPTAEETTGPVDPASEEPAAGPCPYMGLRSFRAEDAQWFFGRERLTADLVARLVEAPLLAVVGASGSGKSSLLGAGLLPAAWAGTVPGASNWITVTLTPTSHPLEELASRVALLRGLAAGGMLADLRSDPRNLRLAVRQTLADAPAEARLLMIIDQLEEIFTLCSDNTETAKLPRCPRRHRRRPRVWGHGGAGDPRGFLPPLRRLPTAGHRPARPPTAGHPNDHRGTAGSDESPGHPRQPVLGAGAGRDHPGGSG